MKRIISLLAVFVLAFSLTIPALAAESDYPVDLAEYDWYVIAGGAMMVGNGTPDFGWSNNILFVRDKSMGTLYHYSSNADEWYIVDTSSISQLLGIIIGGPTQVTYSSHSIPNKDGTGVYFEARPYNSCDGSSCPATDSDMNNVCDDCGQVLTMSLRTSLLDYAKETALRGLEVYPAMTEWLITTNGGSGYSVYVSEKPFTYSTDGYLYTDGVWAETHVYQTSAGENTAETWSYRSDGNTANDMIALGGNTGVDSSYDIEGFFPIPLWVTVEQVAQGGMMAQAPNLMRTMAYLTVSGIGCLALLMVLPLLRKWWATFRS